MQVICGWDALCVRTYGQYCPIARAADLLAERWSIIILRNILIGCRTFNEIADGPRACLAVCFRSGCGTWSAPGSSRSVPSPTVRDRSTSPLKQVGSCRM